MSVEPYVTAVGTDPSGNVGYIWDKKHNRYKSVVLGSYISRKVVRSNLDAIIDKCGTEIRIWTTDLINNDMTLASWQEAMADRIKTLHIVFASAARGGWNNMSANDWKRVSTVIQGQYGYLRKFAEQIYTGEQKPDRQMIVRATLYAEAARTTYEYERRELEIESGSTQEMNILGGNDNCGGCLEATLSGWVEIGTLVPIGARRCGARCRCIMIYRKTPDDEIGTVP